MLPVFVDSLDRAHVHLVFCERHPNKQPVLWFSLQTFATTTSIQSFFFFSETHLCMKVGIV